MTFNDVRCIIEYVEALSRSDLSDYRVIIHDIVPLSILETTIYVDLHNHITKMLYRDIPDCFNCKVHSFEIDSDNKIILIRSEVKEHGKL